MTKRLIYDVRGPVAWFLRWIGMAAITMPWRRIYVLPEFGRHEGLLRHELVHIEQIERDGAWTFTARYLWWLVRYGYWENPYEVDAYGQEPIIEENQYVGWIAEQAEDASAERSGEDAGRGGRHDARSCAAQASGIAGARGPSIDGPDRRRLFAGDISINGRERPADNRTARLACVALWQEGES